MVETLVNIGIGAIAGGLVSWWITARYYSKGTKREDAQVSNARIDRVADTYCRDIIIDTSFSGLIRANVASLESDDEVRELFDRIQHRGKKRPLGKYEPLFDNIDLSRFFRWVGREGIDFHEVSPEDAIARFKENDPGWRRA